MKVIKKLQNKKKERWKKPKIKVSTRSKIISGCTMDEESCGGPGGVIVTSNAP